MPTDILDLIKMAENLSQDSIPENQDQAVSPYGDSADQDFDVTADMMVHDMDDETTLEEEELNEDGENVADELAELEKEGDMPIEDLLAIYGYHEEPTDQSERVPLAEIKPDPLPPLVSVSGEQDYADQSDAEQENRNLAVLDDGDDSSVASPSTQDQSDYAPSPPSNNKNDVFPENQRITRGILAAYNYFNLGETSSSDDDDNEYNPEEWKKEIRMGPEHQAVVPESTCTDTEYQYDGSDKCLWNPREIHESQLQNYLNTLSQPVDSDGAKKDVIRDDEQALYMLLQCDYNTNDALKTKQSQGNPKAEMALWSEEECREFESGLRMFGKDFRQIQQNKVTSRSVGEIVQFYYLWKKTERHDAFSCQSRLAKKKYSFHPGITDYMDRFLDDNESAASSRASSPHNFQSHTHVGNGFFPSQTPAVTTGPTTQSTIHSVPSGSHHSTVSMMSGLSHSSHNHHHHHHHRPQGSETHNSPGRPPQLLQHCVPTSVIVSSQERIETSAKRPRLSDHDNIPRLISTSMSKPPPLKPIASISDNAQTKPSYGESTSRMAESSTSLHRSQGSGGTESLSRVSGSDMYSHKL